MAQYLPPAAIYHVSEPIEFHIRNGLGYCTIRSGPGAFEFRAELSVVFASIEQIKGGVEAFQAEQARERLRAEMSVVPLCELCIRHNLPRD